MAVTCSLSWNVSFWSTTVYYYDWKWPVIKSKFCTTSSVLTLLMNVFILLINHLISYDLQQVLKDVLSHVYGVLKMMLSDAYTYPVYSVWKITSTIGISWMLFLVSVHSLHSVDEFDVRVPNLALYNSVILFCFCMKNKIFKQTAVWLFLNFKAVIEWS